MFLAATRTAAQLLLVTVLVLPFDGGCSSSHKPEVRFDIGLFQDSNAWEESIVAMSQMFSWMGYSVKLINAEYINSRPLSEFRALAVPGGDMYEYAKNISATGKEKIREFVRSGHAYIGICGGAYFAATENYWRGKKLAYESLGLFDGSASGPENNIVEYPDYGMCQLILYDTLFAPESPATHSEWMLYYWGPVLRPNAGANVHVLGRYVVNNEIATLACSYGAGRVFVIGTHPEIEEDSDRDGVEFGNELDERGSDWNFVAQATKWCLRD